MIREIPKNLEARALDALQTIELILDVERTESPGGRAESIADVLSSVLYMHGRDQDTASRDDGWGWSPVALGNEHTGEIAIYVDAWMYRDGRVVETAAGPAYQRALSVDEALAVAQRLALLQSATSDDVCAVIESVLDQGARAERLHPEVFHA